MADPNALLITDVVVFDSETGHLTAPMDVTVRGGAIASVAPAGAAHGDVPAIDGTGRTLLPGLIDAHWHAAFATIPMQAALTADAGYLFANAVRGAHRTLMRGFTTVRDLGGPTFGLKRAIDEGVVSGPRILSSGAFISQTGGHGDFRLPYEVPRGVAGHLSHGEIMGAGAIADGTAEVLRATREQLRQGAAQIKLMAGGGVASSYDPIDVSQYTEAEFRAAVEAAENWGTYVTVHAYTPRAVRTAVDAGVACIEHGQLLDDDTAAMMAEHGVWWSLQPFLDDADAAPVPEPNRDKYLRMVAGTDRAYELAITHGVKVAFGTDVLFDARLAERQGAMLAKLTRWYSPAEVLQLATIRNAELLAMSGERHPYPGRLGVVAEGALADLVLVDGDPLADISLIGRPDETFVAIVKGGRVVKGAELVGSGPA
ncbi:metal-dependent hydrolase family protein [Jiangella endophytica]|uniref:metal-dependent hydrolase family protein n=1 Tax=Jiangella endophytica TaxID=1623398 RepID=UPI000E34DECF|nr:amidohydrolase family protein [Jiangella endophytica]